MPKRNAFTLIELTVVLAILAGVSALTLPLVSETLRSSKRNATRGSLAELQNALLDYWRDTKHLPMDGISTAATETDRLQLQWLFANPTTGDETVDFDPNSRIGWRGTYLAWSTGDEINSGRKYLIDAWDQEFAVQDPSPGATPRDVRIVSAGPNGTFDIPSGTATTSLTAGDLGDDEYVSLLLQ